MEQNQNTPEEDRQQAEIISIICGPDPRPEWQEQMNDLLDRVAEAAKREWEAFMKEDEDDMAAHTAHGAKMEVIAAIRKGLSDI
jgi:hypothetical protein